MYRKRGFFYSILYVILKDFKLKDFKVENDYVTNIKAEIEKQLPSYFRSKKMSKYGYKQHEIKSEYCRFINSHRRFNHYMAEYFNINLVVVDYDNETILDGKEYNDSLNEKNVLIYSKGIYLPIIHICDLPDNFIFKCVVNRFKIYNKLATETDLSFSRDRWQISTKPVEPAIDEPSTAKPVTPAPKSITTKTNKPTLKGFSGYKLPQLQDLANQFGISIKYCDKSNKSKPKTKRQLYDQLKAL